MNLLAPPYRTRIVSALLLAVSVILTITLIDTGWRWVALVLWILALCLLVNEDLHFSSIRVTWRRALPLILLCAIALLIHLFKLSDYQFFSIQDEVRDGGLQALEFARGIRKNFFEYGTYGSHGLLIALINSAMFLITGSSVLTYRLPAALIATVDVLAVYVLGQYFLGKKRALLASLILLCLPHHLYYARTETVVAWSSLIGTLLILTAARAWQEMSARRIQLFGLMVGLSFSFHAGVRMVGMMLAAMLFVYLLRFRRWDRIGNALLGFAVGIGPRALFTTVQILIPNSRLTDSINGDASFIDTCLLITKRYFESMYCFFWRGTLGWFPNHPLLDWSSVCFLLVGIYFAFSQRNIYGRLCAAMVILIPITNSAMTDTIALEHRYAGCFSALAILVSCGAIGLGEKFLFRSFPLVLSSVPRSVLSSVLTSILALAALLPEAKRGFLFFRDEQASASRSSEELDRLFLLSYLAKSMREKWDVEKGNIVCLQEPPQLYEFEKLLHVKEYYQYFFPRWFIRHVRNPQLKENEVGISPGPCQPFVEQSREEYCQLPMRYVCPASRTQFALLFSE